MKKMFVYKMPNGYLRAKKGPLGETLLFDTVKTIDEASKSSSESFFRYVVGDNALGHCEEITSVIVEGKHKQAMHYLKDLLDKELAYAQEQEDIAELPEDRKDYRRDGEKIQLLKELFGL